MNRDGFSAHQERAVTGGKKMKEFDKLMAEIDDPSIQAHIEDLTLNYWYGNHIGQPTEGMMIRDKSERIREGLN